MVMLATVVVYAQAWLMDGGRAGPGWNARSNGHALGSEGRYSMGSMSKVEVGCKYPAVERAGVSIKAKPLRMELCTCILLINLHWKV